MEVTSLSLVGVLLIVAILFVVGMMFFERYFVNIDSKVVSRIICMVIMINICILIFLILSFSKVKFTVGPVGPRGIRGRRGRHGKYQTLNKCQKQSKTIGEEKYELSKRKNIRIQKPVLGNNI